MAVPSLVAQMAARFSMDPKVFEETLKKTVIPQNCTNEQFMSFLAVAHEYNLNPLTREIYAFPSRSGGIQPIVSIDGWLKIINSHPQFDGMEFEDRFDGDGNLVAITCRIYRKDRTHPTEATEYMAECRRNTEPWQKWPRRMLRHKATIQAARYAFGLAGIIDPDEAERFEEARVIDLEHPRDTDKPAPKPLPQTPQAVSIDAVLERIEAAETVSDLLKVAPMARHLPEEHRERAREAYRKRLEALQGAMEAQQ